MLLGFSLLLVPVFFLPALPAAEIGDDSAVRGFNGSGFGVLILYEHHGVMISSSSKTSKSPEFEVTIAFAPPVK